jgi:hypothetical protein
VELEQHRAALEAKGIEVAAVTYDSRETLSRFGKQFSIGYPLLSDRQSEVIRSFGILNTDMPEGSLFHGIPYPGNFLLGPDGRVLAKYFLPDYQTRSSASEILVRSFGTIDGPAVELRHEEVLARVALSDLQVVPGRQLGVTIDLSISEGWHLYGDPLPDGYQPIRVVFDEDLAADQSLELPSPEPLRFELLGETLPVHSGTLRGTGTLLVRSRLRPGSYAVKGELRYQACQEQSCGLPQAIRFEIPIEVIDQAPAIEPATI